jgi:hypothetical protein
MESAFSGEGFFQHVFENVKVFISYLEESGIDWFRLILISRSGVLC